VDLFKSHQDWPNIVRAIQKLQAHGFIAYLAGGCVRDALLRRQPKDFDVATNATPDEIQMIFPKALAIGKSFGVMIVHEKGTQIEIATFRSDGEYFDGRHPSSVSFASPKEDALRRDFTVNALFYDPIKKEIYDFVQGQKDLEKKILRCVGVPKKRFNEDQLRILRAVRFAAQLGFVIESETAEAIKNFKNPLYQVSYERILEELNKLFQAKYPGVGIQLLEKLNLQKPLLPYVKQRHSYWNKVVDIVEATRKENLEIPFLWAGFLFPEKVSTMSEIREWIFERPFPKQLRLKIISILDFYFQILNGSYDEVEILQSFEASQIDISFFEFARIATEKRGESLLEFEKLISFYKAKVGKDGFLPRPLIAGSDLIQLGVKPGPHLGELLSKFYRFQILNDVVDKTVLMKAYSNKEDGIF